MPVEQSKHLLAKRVNMEDSKKAEPALCFVPEMLVDYLNKNNIRTLEPASFFLHGVCLLVDISGFTKLSGQFCDQGKAGIDDLQLATNGFMGQLVDIIYTFGGDIIKFAGDAIVCVFSPDFTPSVRDKPMRRSSAGSFAGIDESYHVGNLDSSSVEYSVSVNTRSSISPEVILRVTHCAKLLTEVQTDKLTVHVAMSCGEMCFGILGGFENRWECLISGPCIHQLSGCLDDAPSKHAVMSRRCARIVRETLASYELKPSEPLITEMEVRGGRYNFSLLPLPSGNYRIQTVSYAGFEGYSPSVKEKVVCEWDNKERSELIKQFVPLPIADQLEQGANLQYLAEIREVKTMFMKWDSYDANGKHRDLLELQACFYQAQRILHNTGAYLRQFLVDDKGCVLIACWGMPHLSYLDNAHRAVTAAAQIRIACYQLEMNCSFGITTGDVYCGTVGSALRMEYAAIGSVVNMSARLMCKANGGILIDDMTYKFLPAHDRASFLTLDPIKVKGRDEPLQVYSYIESGLKHTLDRTSDDMDIPQYCRYPLKELLLHMSDPASLRNSPADMTSGRIEPSTWVSSIRRWFRHRPTGSAGNALAVVLIEGKAGSGRTSVVTWLKNQATEANIQTCCVRLNKKDTSIEYGMFKKLFIQLMPKDLFLNNHVQRGYVQELLRLAYPKADRSLGLEALQHLGITCFTEDAATIHNNALSDASMRKHIVWASDNYKPNVSLQESMRHIFTYLLSVHPTLVIIEGLELADAASLALLLILGSQASPSAIVCTSLAEVADIELVRKTKSSIFGSRSKNKSIIHVGRTVWAREYRDSVLALKNASLITLENYTPEEIDRLLCDSLGVKFVPPEVSQLVQDFSGGSYFWVREILQFIKDHGHESFMSALGEEPVTPNTPAENTSLSRFLRIKAPAASSFYVASSKPASRRASFNEKNDTGALSPVLSSVHAGAYASARNSLNLGPSNDNKPTSKATHKQLDHLLLIRFGNLLQEEQRVLRKASVIGVTFATSVLYTLLSPHLQEHFSECLKTLVNQKWIYQDLTSEHTYQFVHGHVRQLVYELTPPSERNKLHQSVVNHLLQAYPDDKTQYICIWYHYKQFDTDLALEYAVKATSALLESSDLHDYVDAFDVLTKSLKCCDTYYDVYILQQLTERLQEKVENILVHNESSSRKRGWFVRTLLNKKSTHSSKSTANNKITPKDGTSSDETDDENKKSYRLNSSQKTFRSTVDSSKGTIEEEKANTRQQLLEKINDFRSVLSSKSIEFSAEAAGGDQSLNQPSEWQKVYLDMKSLNNKFVC